MQLIDSKGEKMLFRIGLDSPSHAARIKFSRDERAAFLPWLTKSRARAGFDRADARGGHFQFGLHLGIPRGQSEWSSR